MLSTVEERMGKLEESMGDAKESHNALGERIDDLKKLKERNDAIETMVMALKEEIIATTKALNTRIEKLDGELALCQTVVGKRVSNTVLSYEDVPKLKEFVGTRSTDKRQSEIETWQEFQCKLKGQFYPEFTKEVARAKLRWLTQQDTVGKQVREFKELMLQVSDVTEKEVLLAFQNGLKLWVR
ncbi:hypothetical protein Goklo_015679 [Gossypium klotzschianum]|uniref:Retrotransposon gag domain-containing protein n=1 Tax=Gossypium klotzschianum TaxID=34286 RepID=A0A7J8UC34_9ROSI|nr:hypothetical protein [Gossypium klotzschianum]